MSKASRERQKQREANAPKKEWKPCMQLIHKQTGKDFYLYLPEEAISYIPTCPLSFTMLDQAVEILSRNDPDAADFAILKWDNTPYGNITGVISTNPHKFAA